ncbi:hypothetical protein HJG60_011060 [Phyllostomus discolor]|uniref:Uncharacterized protein n=1 Tax=Phyllostomus discolor TaxID=89673 RepID=A0A834ACG9_9CHIR|nr:hypothetical protein HJG60_011060 [Phyllostomus discolor]
MLQQWGEGDSRLWGPSPEVRSWLDRGPLPGPACAVPEAGPQARAWLGGRPVSGPETDSQKAGTKVAMFMVTLERSRNYTSESETIPPAPPLGRISLKPALRRWSSRGGGSATPADCPSPGDCPDPPASAFELGYLSTRAESGPQAHRCMVVTECPDAVPSGIFLNGVSAFFTSASCSTRGFLPAFFI